MLLEFEAGGAEYWNLDFGSGGKFLRGISAGNLLSSLRNAEPFLELCEDLEFF